MISQFCQKSNRNIRSSIIIFLGLLLLSSCDYFTRVEKEQPIARVNNSYLYFSDIEALIPEKISVEDSVSKISSIIDHWVKQELILQKAQLNLSDIEDEIERDVNEYRRSKIIYLYEKELVRQKLDTNVTKNEVEKYYNENKSNFELKDYIIKGIYLKLEKNTPEIEKAKEWMQSENEEDSLKLVDYCHKYALKYLLNNDEWIYFKELNKELDLEILNTADFLEKNKFIVNDDNNYLHLLKIDNYVMKDSISPLSIEAGNIKNILLNKRKITMINKMHNDIYQNAINRSQIEIYNKNE